MKQFRWMALVLCVATALVVGCADNPNDGPSSKAYTVNVTGVKGTTGNTFAQVSVNGQQVALTATGKTGSNGQPLYHATFPKALVPPNKIVTVTAVPAVGYVFDEWEWTDDDRSPVLPLSDSQENNNSVQLYVDDIPYYVADFEPGYYVDASYHGTAVANGSSTAPFTTIAQALTAVSAAVPTASRSDDDIDPFTVIVATGTYAESVSVDIPVSLKGGYNTYDDLYPWSRSYIADNSLLYSTISSMTFTTPATTSIYHDFEWDDMEFDGFAVTGLLSMNLTVNNYYDDDFVSPTVSHNKLGAVTIASTLPVVLSSNMISGVVTSNVLVLLASNMLQTGWSVASTTPYVVLFNNMVDGAVPTATNVRSLNNIYIDPSAATVVFNDSTKDMTLLDKSMFSTASPYMLNQAAQTTANAQYFNLIMKGGMKISESTLERLQVDDDAMDSDFVGRERSDRRYSTWSVGPYEYYPEVDDD